MKDLTSGNIYKNFFVFAFPMVLAGVLSQMYQAIDTVIAGRLIGDNALAAIGVTSPFDTLLNSVFWGYSNGIGVYVANLFGAKKYFRMKNVIINNLWFFSLTIVFVSVFILPFKSQLFYILNIAGEILYEADVYFTICMLGKVFILLSIALVHILNGMGDGSFPLKMSILSAIINISGNIFTVTVFKMGVAGLALSTVLSSAVVVLCYFIRLKKYYKELGANRHKVILSKGIIKDTMHYSIPTMIQQTIMYFSSAVLSPIVNALGKNAAASYTVVLRIYHINSTIYQNSARVIGSHTAQCYGAKKYKRLIRGLWIGILQNISFVMPVLLSCVFLPKQVCGIFFGNGASAEAVGYSVIFLKYFLPLILFNVLANAFHNFFRGIDRMKFLIIATASGTVANIVFSLIFSKIFGIYGIFIGWAMFWVADALIGFVFYLFGKWKKERT